MSSPAMVSGRSLCDFRTNVDAIEFKGVPLKEKIMDTPTWLQIVEIIVAATGLIFGIYEYYQRQRIANVLRTILRSFPGDVAKMEQSCDWGWNNVKHALTEAAKITDGEEKRKIIESLGLAMGDTRSSMNSCVQLFNNLLSFQEAQFGTRDITHPQRDSLGLYRAELGSRTSATTA